MRRLQQASHVAALMLALSICLTGCFGTGSGEKADIRVARDAFNNGFYIEAKNGYERYLQVYPKGDYRLEAWERLLEIALNVKGDLDRAVVLLEAMILEFGESMDVAWQRMFQMGELYEQRGNRNKALETWEKCLDYAGDDEARLVETQIRMAAVHRVLRNYDQALTLLQQSERMAPDGPTRARIQYEEAQTYSFMQSWGQAKEVLEVIMADGVADEEIHSLAVFLLADVYEQELDYGRARELFESIQDTYPNPKVIQVRLKNMGKTR
ncbi:MAG: tetratricopeptide repeat protein [Desulfovibrionaceae bacterium]